MLLLYLLWSQKLLVFSTIPRNTTDFENYTRYNFSLLLIFPEISGKFREILNFRKIYNPNPETWEDHFRLEISRTVENYISQIK